MMLGSVSVSAYAIVFGLLTRFTGVGLPGAAATAWVTAALFGSLPAFKFVQWRARLAAAARAAAAAAAPAPPAGAPDRPAEEAGDEPGVASPASLGGVRAYGKLTA